MIKLRHFNMLLLGILLCHICHAQTTERTTDTGFPINGVFQGSAIDTVQLTSGNLHIQIPIISVKGRGLDVDFNLVYDSKTWTFNTVCDDYGNCTAYVNQGTPISVVSPLGYSITYDTLLKSCYVGTTYYNYYDYTNIVLSEPNGSKHHMVPNTFSDPNGSPCYDAPPVGPQLYADDGSGWRINDLLHGGGIRKDGFVFGPGKLTDRNGNTMGWTSQTLTDTLGRNFPLNPNPYNNPNPFGYYDSSGTFHQLQVTYENVNIQTNLCNWAPQPGTSNYCVESSGSTLLAHTITLPNNMTYTVEYVQGAGGEISSITLPSGGQISYTWSSWQQGDGAGRVVASRTVNDGTHSSIWTYSPGFPSYPPVVFQYLGKGTDPLGNDTTIACGTSAYFSVSTCYVTDTKFYSGSASGGQLLKTVHTDYQELTDSLHTFVDTWLPIRETTTWVQANLISKTETDWETYNYTLSGGWSPPYWPITWRNPNAKREYDWQVGSPGPLLRTTSMTYRHLSNSEYLSKNLADLMTSENLSNGAGTTISKTLYSYDDTSPACTSNISGHDYSNYACTFNVRGNLTQTSRWRNTDGTYLTTTNTYNDVGNLLQTTDPGGNATQFSYSDNFANGTPPQSASAFVTQVRYPSTNGVSHIERKQYYWYTSLLATQCGQNFPSGTTCAKGLAPPQSDYTTYSYDLVNRLTNTVRGDGGQTTVTFNDTVSPLSVTTSSSIGTSQSMVSTALFDGLGRVTQTQITSDPQATVYTDTTYDLLGQVHSVSNPYRTGNDPTTSAGITTYAYDALGRKISETYPDNSILTTAYCGPSTLVTDPTGKWRRSRTDALGRLVEVDEPNAPGASVNSNGCPGTGEPIWVTSYTNDVLGNLTQVVQNGSHQRNFTHDSLSRLLTSSNPETGTITYKYDSDTNCASPNSFPTLLVSKTDARGIRTCAQYDALNRITQKSYSDGNTPTAYFAYEQTSAWGTALTNTVGRLTEQWTGTACCATAGAEIFSYDPMGRILLNEQYTPAMGYRPVNYTYDLAGNTTSITYPSGRVVNYTFDSASRPKTAADGSNGITYATDFQTPPSGCLSGAVCYTPQGTFYALSIGQSSSFTGLNLTHSYNNRLQPNEFRASSSGGNSIPTLSGRSRPGRDILADSFPRLRVISVDGVYPDPVGASEFTLSPLEGVRLFYPLSFSKLSTFNF